MSDKWGFDILNFQFLMSLWVEVKRCKVKLLISISLNVESKWQSYGIIVTTRNKKSIYFAIIYSICVFVICISYAIIVYNDLFFVIYSGEVV